MWLLDSIRSQVAAESTVSLSDGTTDMSLADLASSAGFVASVLGSQGVRPGDVVLLYDADGVAGLSLLLGCCDAGAIPLLLSSRSTELRTGNIAAAVGAEWAIEWAGVPATLSVTRPLGGKAQRSKGRQLKDLRPAPVMIFMTSGTTGPEKAVLHSDASLHWAFQSLDPVSTASPETWLAPLNLSSIGGYVVVCRSIGSGKSLIVPPATAGPRSIIETAADRRVNSLALTPAMLRLVVALAESGRAPSLPALKSIGVGSAPLPESLRVAATTHFDAIVANGYGSTELGGAVLTGPPGLGGRFRVLPGAEVSVGPADELLCKTPASFSGVITAAGVVESPPKDGWLRTGDVARLHPDNTVELLGRLDDLIFRGGYKFRASEVESVIEAFSEVARCAVVEVGHHRSRTVAYMEGYEGGDVPIARLRLAVESQLEEHKWPNEYRVLKNLPTTRTGKVQRYRLRNGE